MGDICRNTDVHGHHAVYLSIFTYGVHVVSFFSVPAYFLLEFKLSLYYSNPHCWNFILQISLHLYTIIASMNIKHFVFHSKIFLIKESNLVLLANMWNFWFQKMQEMSQHTIQTYYIPFLCLHKIEVEVE